MLTAAMFTFSHITTLLRILGCGAAWRLPPRLARPSWRSLRTTRPVTVGGRTFLYPNCPPVGTPAFARYLTGLGRLSRGERVPLSVHLAVTDRCPCACERCSNHSGHHGAERPDPPLAALIRLCADLAAAGTVSLALTGGEPLLRPDLEAIIRACGRDIAPMLFTTGLGLDDRRAQALRQAGLEAVFISLDDVEAEAHDRQRGRPGAFAAALQALAACRAAGIYTAAQAVVTPALLAPGRLEQFLAFCQAQQVHEVMLLEPMPGRLDTDAGPPLTDAARRRLEALQLAAVANRALPKTTTMSFFESPQNLGCQAGFTFLYINTGGEACPCDFLPVAFGNIYALGVRAILDRCATALPFPGCRCLARELRPALAQAAAAGTGRHLPWEQTQALLVGRAPDAVPELMRHLCPQAARHADGKRGGS